MREQDWLCGAFNRQKRKYNSYKGTVGVIAPNRLKRRFKTDRPYQKLVTDVSEFRYGNQSQNERVYLEPVLDLFNGEVLAFNISDHPTVEFALKPLKEALNRIPVLDYRTTVHILTKGFSISIATGKTRLKSTMYFRVCRVKPLVSTTPPWSRFFTL
ncbi:transposase [Lactiplantibacillus plantarum]|nr:transposase [Lactiplantibacillus plantarum]MCG0942743.1 transposase [Lactiplantibacillus plantarum]